MSGSSFDWSGALARLHESLPQGQAGLTASSWTLQNGQAPTVDRILVEVGLGANKELVVLSRKGREVSYQCTGELRALGVTEETVVTAALRELTRAGVGVAQSRQPRQRLESGQLAIPVDEREALQSLLLAVTRSGVDVENPSVLSALDAAKETARPDLHLSRQLGRIERALLRKDTRLLAYLLHGAIAGVATKIPTTRISDRTLYEVARETVSGCETIERRYLVDADGTFYAEEWFKSGAQNFSLGPCPRKLDVGLAEITQAYPRRIRVQQYQVQIANHKELAALSVHARERMADVLTVHNRNIGQTAFHPETVMLVRPTEVTETGRMFDKDGLPFLWANDDDWRAAVSVMQTLCSASGMPSGSVRVHWIACRVVDRKMALTLGPCSLLVERNQAYSFVRLK